MEKTNPKILEEIIRVDHAGERGAIKIYEGQLLALKTIKQDQDLKNKIEEMQQHEKAHLDYFEKEIDKRKKEWKKPPYKFNKGILYKYIKSVSNASEGCVTDQ